MDIAITAYCCPACRTRFALEADACLPDPLHLSCPACGRRDMEFNLLAPEELEAWSLWRTLDTHLACLPAELRLPSSAWSLTDEATPARQGLLARTCPECERRAWVPAGATGCPACAGTQTSSWRRAC